MTTARNEVLSGAVGADVEKRTEYHPAANEYRRNAVLRYRWNSLTAER